jgi:hypothetical protein
VQKEYSRAPQKDESTLAEAKEVLSVPSLGEGVSLFKTCALRTRCSKVGRAKSSEVKATAHLPRPGRARRSYHSLSQNLSPAQTSTEINSPIFGVLSLLFKGTDGGDVAQLSFAMWPKVRAPTAASVCFLTRAQRGFMISV